MKRPKIKTLILIVVVFVMGFGAGAVLSSWRYFSIVLAPLTSGSIMEIAIDAQQLSQGKTDHVLKRKVEAIPFLAKNYYDFLYKFMPEDSRYNALWQVKKYYEISGDPVPAEIKPILESLPPKPLTSCELKRLENSIESIGLRIKPVITCYIGILGSDSYCSASNFQPGGVIHETGRMECGHPGEVSKITWKLFEHKDDADVYLFTRQFPIDSPENQTEQKIIEFTGERMIIFQDEYQVIVIESHKP